MPKKNSGQVSGININLRAHPRDSVGNVFVKWGVNSGKIIIIFTELVALSALFYRFSVDRKIVDLNDQIKKEQTFINNQAAKEEEYRSIQTRLSQIQVITNETDQKVKLINNIISALKTGNFEKTNLAITKNNIRITGNAVSVFAVNSLVDDIKKYPNVGNIKLDDLNSTDQGIQFTLSVELNSLIHDEDTPAPAAPVPNNPVKL